MSVALGLQTETMVAEALMLFIVPDRIASLGSIQRAVGKESISGLHYRDRFTSKLPVTSNHRNRELVHNDGGGER